MTQLQPKMLLIASLKTDSTSESASALYNEITLLLAFKNRKTTYHLDNLQTDFCEFKPYCNFQRQLDMIDARNSIVVNWVPGCHMAYHMTSLESYQE